MKQEKFVNDILKLVSIKSFTGDVEGIRECQNIVIEMARNFGFETSFHGNGRVLVVQPRNLKGVPKLGFVVHLDTVPFDEKEWNHNPLGEIANGRIYGRGILDDKCAIVQSIYALKNLESRIQPSWQLIIGSSEEGEWIDMREFLSENPVLPRTLVTIDGDGVQNGCRGYLDLEFEFERASKKTRYLKELYVPNGANNVVPSKAVARVCDNMFESKGIAAHSSIPETGKNALVNLSKLLSQYSDVTSEFPKYFELIEAIEKNSGDSLGFEPNTSVCLTKCCLIGDTIKVNLNIRLGENMKDVKEVLASIGKRFCCKLTASRLTMPAYVAEDSREIKLMCQAYEQFMGKKIVPSIAKGLGYNAALPNCSIFGPRFAPEDDEPDACHAIDENRSIEDLLKFQKMLEMFVKEFLAN